MQADGASKMFLAAAAVLVLLLVGAGIMLVRSPADMQLVREDERRVQSLKTLGASIERYYRDQGRLPGALADLPQGRGAEGVDPVSGAPYGYRTLDNGRFELCATFAASNLDSTNTDFNFVNGGRYDWRHGAGPVCFTVKVASENERRLGE